MFRTKCLEAGFQGISPDGMPVPTVYASSLFGTGKIVGTGAYLALRTPKSVNVNGFCKQFHGIVDSKPFTPYTKL